MPDGRLNPLMSDDTSAPPVETTNPAACIEAVVFDCDGVLVDSEPLTNSVIVELLAEQGLALTLDETMQRFVGRHIRDEIPAIEAMIGHALPAHWYDTFMQRRNERLAAAVEPVPGVVDFVNVLAQRHVPIAVASGADTNKMRITLGRCGLLPFFDGRFFGSDLVPRAKPAPDVYLCAFKALDVHPSRVLVIEDTITGTLAGTAAGAQVLGLSTYSDAQTLRDAGARWTRSTMPQLATLALSLLDR